MQSNKAASVKELKKKKHLLELKLLSLQQRYEETENDSLLLLYNEIKKQLEKISMRLANDKG